MQTFKDLVEAAADLKKDLGTMDPSQFADLKDAYYSLSDGLYSLRDLSTAGMPATVAAEVKKIQKELAKVQKVMLLGKYL